MSRWSMGVLAVAVAVGAGCVSRPDGRAVFSALQRATQEAGRAVEPSLALVKIPRAESAERSAGSSFMMGMSGSAPSALTGVILTPKGHLLVPELIKPDMEGRIEVWIGDTEYVARPIKADDTLGMTILKVESDEPFTPLCLDSAADLAPGEWGVVITPSDEATDFQKFTSLTVCRGDVAGRYRRYLLGSLPRDASGAPLVNLSGQVVGLVYRGEGLALADLADDLKAFLAEATGVRSPDEEEKQKGWIGAILEPINKEYAQARQLPVASLWIAHANLGGPLAKAGAKDGDLLVALNGRPLRFTGYRTRDYFMKSLRPRVGQPFAVTVVRDGRDLELKGEVGKRPDPEILRAEDIGVTVTDIEDADVVLRNLFTTRGVMVTDVLRGSAAATSGSFGRSLLERQDVIVELAGQPVPDVAAFGRVLDDVRRRHVDEVLIKYWRGPVTGYAGLNLKIGEKDNGVKQ